MSVWSDIVTVIALVMVFEGCICALIPFQMKEFMLRMTTFSTSSVRKVGLLAASVGVLIIWVIRG